ncbi:MAG TPA: hypothetical protein VNX01_09220 [Bacteroidia bacterium]|jgi:hypothetical protein|nr:hypothetical protein [Bacteroidia bacterium]
MIRTRFKKVLLVAPDVFPDQLIADCRDLKHVALISNIFPSLYEFNPDIVIFDYDHLGKDIEKVLRRISINKFYDKLKVCCYKSKPNTKTDDLLKTLGVDHLIYTEDISKSPDNKKAPNNTSTIFDSSILKWVVSASH